MRPARPSLPGRALSVLAGATLAFAASPAALAADNALSELSGEAASAAADGGAITSRTNETLQLAVVVNDRPMGMVAEFVIRGGRLFARREELLSIGIRVPASVPADGDLIGLDGVAGFAARIDQATQTIYITADGDWLVPTVLGEQAPRTDYVFEGSPGATLNYDLIGRAVDGQTFANGALDFRAFSRLGVFSSGMLFYANLDTHDHGQGFKAVRLDTTYVYSDSNALRRYRAGDLISGGLAWTRPVRLGGAQVEHDFSMRPDLITFPLPEVAGSAAVPSTVDVLVNNRPVVSGAVPTGPFSVSEVPVISGSGTVTTTVTDALGRQVTTVTPFYAAPELLAPGLHTYSGEVGLVRRRWSAASADYGDVAGSATYRRGLSSGFTIEGHAEATKGLAMAGVGGVANLWNFAVVNVAVAGSSHGGRSGGQISAGIERISTILSFGASVLVADSHFADIAALNDASVIRRQITAHAGLSLATLGSLGLAFVDLKQPSLIGPPDVVGPPAPATPSPDSRLEHSQLLTASYSRQLGPLSLFASAFHAFAGKKETTFSLGVAMPLGPRTTASVIAQGGNNARSAQADVNRAAVLPGDWGFRALAAINGRPAAGAPWVRDTSDHEFGEVTYKSQWGQVFAGVDRTAGTTTVQGEVVGAVSLIDNAVFLSNRINDSFAVVDTGVSGIHVRQENRDVGRTDGHGRMVVPDLLSFQVNQIAIDPLDAPVDADIALTGRGVRPLDRVGVVVKLPVKVSHGAIVRIIDESGKPLPVGSSATLASTKAAVPIGYDGEAYLVDLQGRNEVTVELPSGRRCAVAFAYQPKPGDIPAIGPVTCREAAQ
ncbi:MAG: fimbria/pilus outer membrane usher protein [Croceibacterium sp.]